MFSGGGESVIAGMLKDGVDVCSGSGDWMSLDCGINSEGIGGGEPVLGCVSAFEVAVDSTSPSFLV